jgi:hypothetical protein
MSADVPLNDAEIARMRELTERGATLEEIIEEARDPASPLHRRFTWDKAKAAEECRLTEARDLLEGIQGIQVKRYRIVIHEPDNKPIVASFRILPSDNKPIVASFRILPPADPS